MPTNLSMKAAHCQLFLDLFETKNLELDYPELIKMCVQVTLGVSEEHINKVEISTQAQASGSGFYRHRAGRIGASQCFSAFHTNLAQPSQSLIKTICYPSLYKVNTKAKWDTHTPKKNKSCRFA